jgi:hypothetical protein
MKKFKITSVAAIAGILLLCAVFSQAQSRKIDTIKVVLLVSDTTHYISEYQVWQSCEQAGCKTPHNSNLFSHFKTIKTDEGNGGYGNCYWTYGYSVREFHYGNEFVNEASCWNCPDYWKHLYYLNDKKKSVKNTGLIIWQSVPVK